MKFSIFVFNIQIKFYYLLLTYMLSKNAKIQLLSYGLLFIFKRKQNSELLLKMISQKAKTVFFSNLNTFANITLGQIFFL
jgi:hypothetical protein